jgi:twitching motility protein PilI
MGTAISARHAGLRDFQQHLARRLQAAANLHGTTQDCVAASTVTRRWLFDLACAAEVITVPTLAAVPFTLAWYLGLISHRGELTGVIDLDGLTGAPVTPWADTDRLLVLSPALPLRCAIRVSQLTGIVDRTALRAAPRAPELPDWSPLSYDDDDGVRRAWVDLDVLMRNPVFIDIGWR